MKDETIEHPYGPDAIVVRLGKINIVHLENPSEETIRQRTEEVMRDELTDDFFFVDCPLCQDIKNHPRDIVYYPQERVKG